MDSDESTQPAPSVTDLYPPSPQVRELLTPVTGSYRLRVVLVLLSLFLFLAVYLGLLAGSAYLVSMSWSLPVGRGRYSWLVKAGAVAGSLMLFLFLLKGLFKRHRIDRSNRFEVREADQPALFRFVRRVCRETGSPFPRAIYLSHDVNAAVFYPRSLLSLVWPVRKNLLVGLGLVNSVNLSELKAVLAHEFGHFAQSSMKLGQYVYVANQVIGDMAFGRDFWDTVLEQWRRLDIRLSFPAWALSGIVWVLRRVLEQIFRAINFLNFSLSRQMELNADLHSVLLTGSDTPISTLWKVERGSLAFQMALRDLFSLAEHGKHSKDVFYHQGASLRRLDEMLKEGPPDDPQVAALGRAYQAGREIHFPAGEKAPSGAFETHPSNHEREVNAKRIYVPLAPDERHAWLLFGSGSALRTALTRAAYREHLGIDPEPGKLLPPERVEQLVLEERREMEQAEHYRGFYDGRPLRPGNLQALAKELGELEAAGRIDLAALRAEAAAWRGEGLRSFVESWNRLQVEAERSPAAEQTQRDREAMERQLDAADRAVFRYFFALSGPAGRGSAEKRLELVQRYDFLVQVQGLIARLKTAEALWAPILAQLQEGRKIDEDEAKALHGALSRGRAELGRVVEDCEGILLPRLSHLEAESTVRSFVIPEDLVPPPDPRKLAGEWIGGFLGQFAQALGRLGKLHFKNLGLLLKLQEELDPELHGVTVTKGRGSTPGYTRL
ncbi:MAG: M48 family metalloprotease [Planctomycetes bacterium]|nr:M48 family metalloprotease [Planctomycetota bacterium]